MGTKHTFFRSMNRAMSRSDYCRLLHCTTNSSPALTEENFMPKALFTAVLAASFASAAASYSQYPAQPPAAPAMKAVTTEKPTRMTLQSGAETVKVRAVYSPDVRPNPPQTLASADDEADASQSGWRSYGMLLATLVLMGVIAVRRFSAGRH
jgi:hypothetical protein